ncbi:MAG: 2-dehydro-3-deoxygalactonokinase [Bosea sp. (in: a-proteobacteria)]
MVAVMMAPSRISLWGFTTGGGCFFIGLAAKSSGMDMGPLLAIDWGTSRARAYLMGQDGAVIARNVSDEGIQKVPAGGFPAAFKRLVAPLLALSPIATPVFAGMVGSRNGWQEVGYLPCPASLHDLADALVPLDAASRPGWLVPGLSCEGAAFDVMRGEETLAFGAGVTDGLICLPGTHSKWVEMRAGRITRFASFMTGEVFGLLRHQSILSRLAEPDAPVSNDEQAGLAFQQGLLASRKPGGLLHHAFAARTGVLSERLSPDHVGPYLSGLMIGQEVDGAQALFGDFEEVTLIAEGEVRFNYAAALCAQAQLNVVDPDQAFVAGITAIMDQARKRSATS